MGASAGLEGAHLFTLDEPVVYWQVVPEQQSD